MGKVYDWFEERLEITYEEIDKEDVERLNAGDIKFGFIKTKVLNTGEGIDK